MSLNSTFQSEKPKKKIPFKLQEFFFFILQLPLSHSAQRIRQINFNSH